MTQDCALSGFYEILFLYLEPASTMLPAIMAWIFPGAAWFHHQLIPAATGGPVADGLDPRTRMAIWQLGSCYLLLGLVSSLVFRAARNAEPKDLAAQERITGSLLIALALGDVVHMVLSFSGLPDNLKRDPLAWNSMTHGNITVVIFLLFARLSWFAGFGRRSAYYGQGSLKAAKKA